MCTYDNGLIIAKSLIKLIYRNIHNFDLISNSKSCATLAFALLLSCSPVSAKLSHGRFADWF